MLSRISTALVFACLVAGCATSPTGRKQLMSVSENQAVVAHALAKLVPQMMPYYKAAPPWPSYPVRVGAAAV